MSISTTLDAANGVAERTTDWLATPLLFAFRWYVAWQFLKSGWLKVSNWDSTLYLFQEEYHVPLLSPQMAAVAGTTGELVFPVLLIISAKGSRQRSASTISGARCCSSCSCSAQADGRSTGAGARLWAAGSRP